jgi:hypothetical protein
MEASGRKAAAAGALSFALLLGVVVGFAYLLNGRASRPAPPVPADELAFGAPTVADCAAPSPADLIDTGLPELHGKASHAELWALVFRRLPLVAGQEIKIVWRMTGGGTFRIGARNIDGAFALLTFGPEQHGGSSWRRPGQEWGTGFIFPKRGCWRIHAQREEAVGDVYVLVTPHASPPSAASVSSGDWPQAMLPRRRPPP